MPLSPFSRKNDVQYFLKITRHNDQTTITSGAWEGRMNPSSEHNKILNSQYATSFTFY